MTDCVHGIFSAGFTLPVPLPPIPPSLIQQPATTAQVIGLAGEAIGGHRGVRMDADGVVWLAEPTQWSGMFLPGITFGASSIGEDSTFCIAGRMEEAGWDWDEGYVWLGPAGTLTQVLPDSGPLILAGLGSGHFLLVRPALIAIR